ncbi:MAG: histidine kinase [Salaquimonas sp.]|nr:histidine kinase [Salaquimonas sp.]
MPSLIRFLVICAIIAGGIYGGMVALATMVEPNQREMTVRIPPAKLKPQ